MTVTIDTEPTSKTKAIWHSLIINFTLIFEKSVAYFLHLVFIKNYMQNTHNMQNTQYVMLFLLRPDRNSQ